MRIDFNGAFKQVVKLMDASAGPAPAAERTTGFAETLAGIDRQPHETPAHSVIVPEAIPPPPPDLMASLNFNAPSGKAPPLEPFSGQLLGPEQVKEAAPSVKTPAVIEVKRISSFEGLSYSERMKKVENLVSEVGKESGIDPALGMAVAQAESSFDPKAVSSDGHASKGLFQLLDGTGKELHEESGSEAKYDPFNPDQNVKLGLQYLRRLHNTFSQNTKLPSESEAITAANSSSLEKLAVAAFNAGEGRVASAQARAKAAGFNPGLYEQVESYLPKSTQEYVSRVMQLKTQFEHDDIG